MKSKFRVGKKMSICYCIVHFIKTFGNVWTIDQLIQ